MGDSQLPHRTGDAEPGKVACVVTAFNPPQDLCDRLLALKRQADRIVVVNDGSQPGYDRIFGALSGLGVDVVHHSENQGIAAALNSGVRRALSADDIIAVITLDQDSEVAGDYVERCRSAQLSAELAGRRLGILAAESMNGTPVPARSSRGRIEPYDPMQSGLYVPTSTFDAVGLFDEGLFIDAVDSEYVLRTRAMGLAVEFAPGTDLFHALGVQTPMRLFSREIRRNGRPSSFSAHTPVRLYYITRNRLSTNARYVAKDPVWVARRVYDDLMLVGRNLLFGPNKWKSAMAVWLGLAHAVSRKQGKIDPSAAERLAV